MQLILETDEQRELWNDVVDVIVSYSHDVRSRRVGANFNQSDVLEFLSGLNFEKPWDPQRAIRFAVEMSSQFQTQIAHPRYFGLFDPPPTTMGIIGEALAAAFNPQLSAWTQSPGAVELERMIIGLFAEKFGYARSLSDGTFTSGGAEATHTAVITALTNAFPDFSRHGVRALSGAPVLYVSMEAHHSVVKAARACGLGSESVRRVEVDDHLRMEPAALKEMIRADRQAGLLPFLVVATLGTTNSGAIDPANELANIASDEGIWLHADAAWGGAVALVPELRWLLQGIERADSITFDAHKWLAIPRGAGLYLTRHPRVLANAFHVDARYMPVNGEEVVNPYKHSLQWTRHFTGLKVFLTLAVTGWSGYADSIRHQLKMARYLRDRLQSAEWEIVNDISLGVVCFFDRTSADGAEFSFLEAIRFEVVASGRAWVSVVQLPNGQCALRACVVNPHTSETDVDVLITTLGSARSGRLCRKTVYGHKEAQKTQKDFC